MFLAFGLIRALQAHGIGSSEAAGWMQAIGAIGAIGGAFGIGRLFNHLLNLPLAYFQARRVGDSVARVRELENIRNFLTGNALTVVMDLLFAERIITVEKGEIVEEGTHDELIQRRGGRYASLWQHQTGYLHVA
ncbi:ABC transporter transmembrane region family protein [Collimonas pratensis]|uniref:ABC transporter transmembrane region family protein n=1 Tax=Collimonas pratensis TaxID=279113 RepID=A0A127Q2P1_9BURK|nr:ABC transporter transmembrane region family protein [Collimonas pratensis]